MLKQFAQFGTAIVATHYVACFIQVFLHAHLGHDRRGGFMFRGHLQNHHAIYRDVYTTPQYIDEDESLTICYLLPIAVCAAFSFWLLPTAVAIVVLATFLASLALHVYFHVQFHLENSLWTRYVWFRRRQFLHRLHHEQPDRNFAVIEPLWDRLLGTYTEEEMTSCEGKL